MNLVLGLLVLGGSAISIWGGITDPEGGVWAGLRNAFAGTPNSKHASTTASAYLASLVPTSVAVDGGGILSGPFPMPGASGTTPPSVKVGKGKYNAGNHTYTVAQGGITHVYQMHNGKWEAGAIAAGAPASAQTGSGGGAASGKRAAVLATARTWLGVRYKWGGNTRAGVDCSGLVRNVYAAHGVNLPRTSAGQQTRGRNIKRASLQPGDLVFWGVPAHHVAIFIGGDQVLHATHPGSDVKIEALSSVSRSLPGSPATYRDVL